MERNKELRKEEIKTKGYDFPKYKPPSKLQPRKDEKEIKITLSWIEKAIYGIKRFFGFFGEAAKTIKNGITLIPQIKTTLWLALAVGVLIIVIIIIT